MLKEGIIEKCKSKWSSPVLLIPKKLDVSGLRKWRLVIDYRKLNNCIEDDRIPLPNITETLDSLSGCIYFSQGLQDLLRKHFLCTSYVRKVYLLFGILGVYNLLII